MNDGSDTGRIRLLLVEDDAEAGEMIAVSVKRNGYETTLVPDGEQAFRLWRDQIFDVIVADIRLKGMDGVELLTHIREKDPDFPFILMTGYDIMDAAIKAVKLGAQDYILKPLRSIDDLTKPVERAVKSYRLLRENLALQETLKRSESQYRALAAHLESVREDERTCLSRKIHDDCGHALAAMKMDLSWLAKHIDGLPDSDTTRAIKDRLREMLVMVDSIISRVRNLASELRPGLLDDIGLSAAIEWQARKFESQTGIKCVIGVDDTVQKVDPGVATGLFRIFEELLANVVRHSQATRVDVGLRAELGDLVLRVEDNGVGITAEQVDALSSLGLIGIRERVRIMGGRCEIHGEAGHGTKVAVTVPLPAREETRHEDSHSG